ncbi:hypothetical protein CEXT_651101 [Caerostris extrusa]|uniref:Uncharacterized protein n=1 Tax=Caerostris extrusa TaxID=172846 RepID=A0AAV4T492_CAEEX|nr:hypothetical protein CEXT_651101 [Caerostris extrusa]
MPARRPTTISEVLDKEGRLRSMTRRHHNERELSLPLCIRLPPPLPGSMPPDPPPEFHNAVCTGEPSLLRPSFTNKDMRPFIFKYCKDIEAHVCAFNNKYRRGARPLECQGNLLLCHYRAPVVTFSRISLNAFGLSFQFENTST